MEKFLVHKLIEGKTVEFPNKTAIEEGEYNVTYQELNEKCNQFSGLLREIGISEDVIAVVWMPANIQLVVSIISIMKSGGIYLPIDTQFSKKRLKQIFENTFHGILITTSERHAYVLDIIQKLNVDLKYLLVFSDHNTLNLYGPSNELLKTIDIREKIYPVSNSLHGNHPEQANYIFYTSGSTGEGKAILGCHKSLGHYISWAVKEFSIDCSFRVGHLSPATFDTSLMDIFMALCSGATLCIPPAGIKENTFRLIEWIESSKISTFITVPSVFRVMTKNLKRMDGSASVFPQLKYIMLCGEVLYSRDITNWQALAGDNSEIINLYGTTEGFTGTSFIL